MSPKLLILHQKLVAMATYLKGYLWQNLGLCIYLAQRGSKAECNIAVLIPEILNGHWLQHAQI